MESSMTEADRILLDVCTSYIMTLIGYMDNSLFAVRSHMREILDNYQRNKETYDNTKRIILDDIIKNLPLIEQLKIEFVGAKKYGKFYEDLYEFHHMNDLGEYFIKKDRSIRKTKYLNVKTLAPLRNTLIGLDADVGNHWIFVDNDLKIHNPYNYDMQHHGSHQFCQGYSLLMALAPMTRTKLECDDKKMSPRKCAYLVLLSFLDIFLNVIVLEGLHKDLQEEIIETIEEANIEEKPVYVKKALRKLKETVYDDRYLSNSLWAKCITNNILEVMQSENAKNEVPEFM